MKATKERETSQGKSCQSKRKLRLWEVKEEKVEKWEKNEENHSSSGSLVNHRERNILNILY